MKALLQRTTEASVKVDGHIIGEIQQGIVVLLGIEKHDTQAVADQCLQKIINYRIFNDENGKMNLSANDISADLLIISQFTLAAQTKKGLRPGFSSAAPPEQAKGLYDYFIQKSLNLTEGTQSKIATGEFGADMKVALINDGPVTFMLEYPA